MIVDAIATEKNGLWGRAYVDGGHNTSAGLQVGGQWLTEITEQLHKAYMSIRAFSWMSVMVGDPLYRPHASWRQIEPKREAAKSGSDWEAYHQFAVKNAAHPAAEFRTLARQMASRTGNGPLIEDLGLMEARDGNFSAAINDFQQARAFYSTRDGTLRAVLEQADAWIKQNKPKRAVDLLRNVLRIASDAPAAPLLRKFEEDAGRAASEATPLR